MKKILLVVLILTLFLVCIAACGSVESDARIMFLKQEDCTITGTIQNFGSQDLEDVEVFVKCYDASDKRIEKLSYYVGDLGAGQSASFNVALSWGTCQTATRCEADGRGRHR